MARIEGNAVIIETNWSELKQQIDNRGLNYRFEENSTAYEIFAIDNQYIYTTIIYKSGQAPENQATYDSYRIDFENNYKNRRVDLTSTNPIYLTNNDGYSIILQNGALINSSYNDGYGLGFIGSDGNNYRLIRTDSSGRITVVGSGSAGSSSGGVLSVQGVSGGVNLPISGTVTVTQSTASNLNAVVQGAGASGSIVVGNPVRVAGWDGTNTRNILTDTNGQIKVNVSSPSNFISITLSYVESIAVAGAQANLFYNGLIYTVPDGYNFICSQFNSSSSDNRVTARVSKFLTLGTYNLGENSFTSGSSYSSPAFASYLEAEVTTVIGGTNDITLTATYTNQSGVSGRTATTIIKKNTPVGYKGIFTLQNGDFGIISVQNITRSAANTGVLSIKAGVEFYIQSMTTANLNYIVTPALQTMRVLSGETVELAWSSNAAATADRVIKVAGGLEVSQ